MRLQSKFSVVALAVVAAAGLAGCDDYFERRDGVTLGAGDAVAINRATQTIERWPHAAREDYWKSDGERMRRAFEKYQTRGAGPGPASAAAAGAAAPGDPGDQSAAQDRATSQITK